MSSDEIPNNYDAYDNGFGVDYHPTSQSHPQSSSEVALRGDFSSEDRKHLQELTRGPNVVPPRTIALSEEADPAGLLGHEDTYAAYASQLFKSCEGIFNSLASGNPDTYTQFKTHSKHPDKHPTIHMPEMEVSDLYTYQLSRTGTGNNVNYYFRRTDAKRNNTGFYIQRSIHGDIVIKSIECQTDELMQDDEYFRLMFNAKKWIDFYAGKMGINVSLLAEYAKQPPELRKLREIAKDGLTAAYTVRKKSYGTSNRRGLTRMNQRHPRYTTIAATVAAITAGAYMLIPEHHTIPPKPKPTAGQLFDLQNVHLPADALTLASGETAFIPDIRDYDTAVTHAPDFPSTVKAGSVRHLANAAKVYADGFGGLTANSCSADIPVGTAFSKVKAIDTNRTLAKSITLGYGKDGLKACNVTAQDITYDQLGSLYIEPLS
jgi:hypothetical protein